MAAAKKTTATKKRAPAKKPAAKKAAAKKPAAKRAAAKKPAAARQTRAADRADKSVEAFREALERSFREVVDDAVKRGRMTRDDANEIVNKLVSKGRKQTEDLIKEVDKAIAQARKEVDTRTTKARKRVETRATKARKSARKSADRATKAVIEAADEPLAQADKLRARAGLPGFPITAYDGLSAAQVKSRVGDLTKADARKVRTYEKRNKGRKSILDAVEKRLAS